jgi:hypothetical protein
VRGRGVAACIVAVGTGSADGDAAARGCRDNRAVNPASFSILSGIDDYPKVRKAGKGLTFSFCLLNQLSIGSRSLAQYL